MAAPAEQPPQYSRPHPAHSALVWVGIVAGVVFVVAVVFFAGFFIGRNASFGVDRDRDGGPYPGMMYPGQVGPSGPMGPGMMRPGGTWDPDSPGTPGQQSPATTPSTPRP